ncbi:MAG: prepilin-type N-terminal cleavage/methylation domain-containing protein [Bacteroidota bacterium]|nr:prepilin-type N-terminal cleavage/methylation domain-containing protein [Bacteroidota bacterium]
MDRTGRIYSNKRLPAFTLVEIVLTMVISSVVIGLIYSGYFMIRQQMLSEDFNQSKDAVMLKYTLDYSFFKSDSILWRNDTLIFKDTCEIARFCFDASHVLIYKGNSIDTLKIKTDSLQFGFLSETRLVNGFEFQILTKPRNIKYRFSKQYPQETKFNSKNISFEY